MAPYVKLSVYYLGKYPIRALSNLSIWIFSHDLHDASCDSGPEY